DHDQLQLNTVVQKFSLVNTANDYSDFLSIVDAAIIATPPNTHNKILADCINANIHVLCEKPLSTKSLESKKIITRKNENLLLGMCHTYRLFPNRLKVRSL